MPKLGIKYRAPPIAVRLHDVEFDFVVALADSRNVAVSQVIRDAVRSYMESHRTMLVMPIG